MHNIKQLGGRTCRRVGLLTLGMIPMLFACNTDKLLQVTDPDVARPSALTGPSALPTLRNGAVGDFGFAYNTNTPDGLQQVQLSGLLSDEFINTETFPTRIEVDQRAISLTNTTLGNSDAGSTGGGTFAALGKARASAQSAVDGYRQFAKTSLDSAGLSEVLALDGLTYVLFAENYCGAVPLSVQAADGSFTYGTPMTTDQMLDSAISKFDQALKGGGSSLTGTFKSLAQVGKGRALLDKNQFAAAAAAVAGVSTTFQYNYQHSETSTRQNNGTWLLTVSVGRLGEANKEGGTGLPFQSDGDVKDTTRKPDPRVADSLRGGTHKGFDGTTNQYIQTKYPLRASAITIADGVEARLIEAEAALRGGDPASALAILNALRSNGALLSLRGYLAGSLPALTQQTGTAAQVDQLFKERAYWLFLTSHRLGDLRRLIRQYGRGSESVFPTGAYFKGGTYGTDVNAPVPQQEQNNPNYTAGSCKQNQA